MDDNSPKSENEDITKDDVLRLLDLGRLLKSVLAEEELCNLKDLLSENEITE